MDVAFRADRVISRIRTINGNVAIFSTGYFLRVLTARWLGLDASPRRYFKLGTAALSVLSCDHCNVSEPAIRLLNERHHRDSSHRDPAVYEYRAEQPMLGFHRSQYLSQQIVALTEEHVTLGPSD